MTTKSRTIFICLLTFSILALTEAFVFFRTRTVTLEIGLFAGSYWGVADSDTYRIVDNVIKSFEEEHPGVKVHYESGIRKADYSEWYAEKVLQGKTPDVALILPEDLNQLISLGVLEDLTTHIGADYSFDQRRFYSTAFNAGRSANRQYALPYEAVSDLMIVNKSLLAGSGIRVPEYNWTWDDLYSICEKVTKDSNGDGVPESFGICNYTWENAVYANNGRLFDDTGAECFFTDKEVSEAVRFISRLYGLNSGHTVTQAEFDAGQVAFMPLSFAEYRTYKTYPYKTKKYSSFEWDCITMPGGPRGFNKSEVNTLLMGISRRSRYKQLSWELLKKFTYDYETQMNIYKYSRGASVLRSVTVSREAERMLEESTGEGNPSVDLSLMDQILENGVNVQRFLKYDEVMSYADNEINSIIREEKNVDSTLKIIQRNVQNMLIR